jgi:hypothetical protein
MGNARYYYKKQILEAFFLQKRQLEEVGFYLELT